MNEFTLNLRNALAVLDPKDINNHLKSHEVTIAGMTLRPGIYGRPKGYAKAFLILTADSKAFYKNKHGIVSNPLTEKAFLTHWNSGMSTFLEEI